jgi:hypothetical protein
MRGRVYDNESPSEATVLNETLLALGQHCGHYLHIWRQNTGAMRAANGRLVRFGMPGMADLSGILQGGQRVEIECKTRMGRLTPQQAKWARMIVRRGGLYLRVCDPMEAVRQVEEHARVVGVVR